MRSVATTRIPNADSIPMKSNPMGPAPATQTVSPFRRGRLRMPLSTVFTGSSMAPSSKLFLAGIFTNPGRQKSMTRTNSA